MASQLELPMKHTSGALVDDRNGAAEPVTPVVINGKTRGNTVLCDYVLGVFESDRLIVGPIAATRQHAKERRKTR